MRPTTSTMLQQNNNNNYPCLNMSDSTQEMLQKYSRSSLTFPSRLELGELPLIRGLRAWALCSKNRRKAGSLLGRGKAPTSPPLGRGSSTSCLRPADVYLSGELGRMGYRLPQGLDARQAGIGALVTVATLKTSEGSGKTQTQCLFLRTEKGSCLYATPKPSSGGTTSMVGDLLRGKRRGGTDSLPEQADANQVRVRSGRRWRKSNNVAAREKTAVSGEGQHRSWDSPAAEPGVERQNKGGGDSKRFSSPQRDSSRVRCSHNASPKSCIQCRRGPPRRESRDVKEASESPGRGNCEEKEMRQKNEEEEEGKGGLSNTNSADLESDSSHRDSHSSCDVNEDEDMRGAERIAGLRTQTSPSQDDFTEREDPDSDDTRKQTDRRGFMVTHSDRKAEDEPCEAAASVGGSDQDESESGSISSEVSLRTETSSIPTEGRVCDSDHQDTEEEEPASSNFQFQEEDFVANKSKTGNKVLIEHQGLQMFWKNEENNNKVEEKEVLSSPPQQQVPSISETDGRRQVDVYTCNKEDGGKGDASEEVKGCSISKDDWSVESQETWNKRSRDVCGQTVNTHVESNGETSSNIFNSVNSPTSISLLNPTPSLHLLASMATDPPCLKTEEETQEEVTEEGGGSQKEKRRQGKELEERYEEEKVSSVDTEVGKKDEEEDEFGVFMQAEGEPGWSAGVNMSASVPCGSRGSIALGNNTITGESTHCKAEWTGGVFHQSDDTWTAFPQDTSDSGRDAEQWWPAGAVEAKKDRVSTNHSLDSVFAEAFPSPSSPSSGDLHASPTLTQLLRSRANQDQGLLDNFHDLNKMIAQSYKRANSVSRDLLLKTLHLQQPIPENKPPSWTTSRRLSPGLPSTNHHSHHAAAKRRLSCDYNRNMVE